MAKRSTIVGMRQHLVIRREAYVAGTRERPEVGIFTQTHRRRPPVPWSRIGVGEDGAPTLSLRDTSGRVRAFLTVATDMVGLVLNGADQSHLSLTADGTINVGMADRSGRRDRFFVGLTPEGTPAASMSSADGRRIWSVP